MNFNMNDVYVAQERYADMRREAEREQASARMMSGMAVTRGANIAASIAGWMRQAMRLVPVVNARMSAQES